MNQSTPATDQPTQPANHSSTETAMETAIADQTPSTLPSANEPPPSYVKLAMRNMVKKGSKSLFHFALTSIGLLTVLVGLAYLTR